MAHDTLPGGTVAFLFTDIEGSTKRWEAHGPAMGEALARHDAIVRDAIEAHGGAIFKTVGDAFCAAFATAPDAAQAALAGQRGLAGRDWGSVGSIRARMAIHAGVGEERDRDYFGPTVNRVARLLAAGHGGQVLLSQAAAHLVRDVLSAEMSLRDLGEHRLKDLERPERIFQLLASDLPGDFPPLQTLDRQRHNLPVQLTPFVGREREVAQIKAIVGEPSVRLVTLTGPGGTGKTRLALQAAADLVDDFPDGVWVVELAAITEPELVPTAVAQAVGVREIPGRSVIGAIAEHLRLMQALLVLDNCEQVLAATPLLGDALRACPSMKVLATSRAPLRVSGEREVPIPPLALPDAADAPSAADVLRSEAGRLFAERAQGVRPTFALTEDNASAVAQICRRLDGLPLAIELAAARVKLLPPPALLPRLENRLRLLTGGARDQPERQQTLRGAIAWSHDLLTPGEQALFRRLGVFAGGCTLEAAEAVCAPDGDLDVLDGLASLTDKSLIRQVEQEGREPRFAMLETIREFALERLAAGGDEEAIRQAHAAWCLGLAEGAEPTLLVGVGQAGVLGVLAAEHDNLRAALAWALERDPPTALRLAGALGRFWLVRMHLDEGAGGWRGRSSGARKARPRRGRRR